MKSTFQRLDLDNRKICYRKLANKCCTLFAGSSQVKGTKSISVHTHMPMEPSGLSNYGLRNKRMERIGLSTLRLQRCTLLKIFKGTLLVLP